MSGRDAAAGPGPVLVVVHEVADRAPGAALLLDVRGLRTDADAELLAARIAERHRGFQVTLDCAGPGGHTLRLLPGTDGGPALLGPELLADLLGPYPGTGEPLALAGHQRELLLEAVTRPDGPDRHLEQVHWTWTGPLERARFRAAWQSVCERESVLRAAFDWAAQPRLVLHARADADIVHHRARDIGWRDLLERDRRQGFALNRPPLLRLTVLEAEADGPARILLTYHRALLDERSVHLLLREFYRAYLAGGRLPGGERRPDLRDHARWLARQNTEGARQLWTRTAPPRHAATAVGRRGGATRQSGAGRLYRRLAEPHTSRLRSWAAARGAGESSALHVVWALLLYRAAGIEGPLQVSFGVRLSGRDILMPGAAGVPGLLAGPLPMTVRVDPAQPLADLLRQVRDALLDMAAYPWVSSDRIREWTGRDDGERLTDTLVSFDGPAELPQALREELRAQGVEVAEPRQAGGGAGLPLTVFARHENGGALVLNAVYDRSSLADADASAALGQCVSLLRALAELPDQHATVGQALDLLADVDVPSMARLLPRPGRTGARKLRTGAPGADLICLVLVAGAARGAYELFARRHRGPEEVVVLDLAGPPARGAAGALPRELTEARAAGRRLVLCGSGPGARAAYELARGLAYGGGDAVHVVMTGVSGPESSAHALAQGLAALPVRRP
ncbi:condensation domain-containing protein [Streptomyces sp. NPDC044571]|uniref:condensation domain-containing protein n=1 Tax=Streptomyces sp. NPDC044571 TaxID=3155371 RepID=UPI0033D46550